MLPRARAWQPAYMTRGIDEALKGADVRCVCECCTRKKPASSKRTRARIAAHRTVLHRGHPVSPDTPARPRLLPEGQANVVRQHETVLLNVAQIGAVWDTGTRRQLVNSTCE